MKAVVVHEYGGPDVLKFEEYPDPVPGPGECWCGSPPLVFIPSTTSGVLD